MARFNHYIGRSKMTIIFDGPPGTKLGEGEIDGMHELLADDDLPTCELPDEPDEEELVELAKAAGPTLSAAEAAERKVADRIYTALRAAAAAAEQIAGAAHTAMSPDAAVGGLRRSGLARLYGLAIDRLLPVMEAGGRAATDTAIVQTARCTIGKGRRRPPQGQHRPAQRQDSFLPRPVPDGQDPRAERPSRKARSAASSPTAWRPATRRPRWRR